MGSVEKLHPREPLAELNKTVTPVTSETHKILQNLDSGLRTIHFRGRLRRNDVEGVLQEARKIGQ
jgi:hypothetical protein